MTTAKTKSFTYTVIGHGSFPIDMLRYDRATPLHESDSGAIESTFRRNGSGTWQVELLAQHRPEEMRWRSFSVTVHNVKEESR